MLNNYFCHLESGGNDVECPACHNKFDVVWDTEYGDPLGSDQEMECPYCEFEFIMDVQINSPTYRVKK